MKRTALLSLILTVAACGEPSDELETRAQPLTRVCGANKYEGPQGVDVSTYQPNYDWAAQAADGVRFGYARISNGTGIIDDQFDRNWPEMKAQGIYRGAYQYFRPGQDAVAQANLMVEKIGRLARGDMPAMIDVETADGEPASVVAAKVREWLDIVEAGTGKKPTIYTGAYFWQDNVGDDSFGEYPLWIANYGADCPLVPDGWATWTFWQYCDGNTDYCTNGQGFDRDVFNGTDEQLDEMANGVAWSAEIVDISQPVNASTGELVSVFVELKNTGAATWDSGTRLATTQPRDRDSEHAAPDWLAPNRVAAVAGTVGPDETYRFEFQLKALGPRMSSESFGLVQEGVAWFADAGGPADTDIVFEMNVALPDDTSDPMPEDPGTGNNDTGTGGSPNTTEGGMAGGDELPETVGPSPGVDGCSQSSAAPSVWALLVVGFLGIRRRR